MTDRREDPIADLLQQADEGLQRARAWWLERMEEQKRQQQAKNPTPDMREEKHRYDNAIEYLKHQRYMGISTATSTLAIQCLSRAIRLYTHQAGIKDLIKYTDPLPDQVRKRSRAPTSKIELGSFRARTQSTPTMSMRNLAISLGG